jgi:hypothetical protein
MPKYPARTYEDIDKKKTYSPKLPNHDLDDYDWLRRKLKIKHLEETKSFQKKHPKASSFLKEKGLGFDKLREHSSKIIGGAALTGALFLRPVGELGSLPTAYEFLSKLGLSEGGSSESKQKLLIESLEKILPQKPRALSGDEEKLLEQLFEQVLGVKAKASLEGEHLNTSYGYIGAEQHLRRYPGDSLSAHGEGDALAEGMAPGLGAWGYFAPTQSALTESLKNTEKWYAVVQTLYLPDWSSRQPYLRDWYKYRKVLIVNTNNGNAVVAAIADSGPAAWTGKQFGGSPEVMEYLGGKNYKKGTVLVFFVDDPENKIPLGPVDYNTISLPEGSLIKT